MANRSDDTVHSGSDDEAQRLLEREFPNLDSGLIAAILYDTSDVNQAREILKPLGLETIVDECSSHCTDTTRDPSSSNSTSDWASWNNDYDRTTRDLASLVFSEDGSVSGSSSGSSSEKSRGIDPERDDPELVDLAQMFPTMGKFSLQRTLERCNNDVDRAVDELLNRGFLESDGVGRGVDGFSADQVAGGGKKKKGKRQQFALSRFADTGDWYMNGGGAPTGPGTSRWNAMKEEIEFVSRGLGLPLQTVASAFHANGGKLAPTITYLLDTYDDGSTEAEDSEEHCAQLADLGDEFGKAVNSKYLDKLLRFCKSDKAAVFQLADILSQYRPPAPAVSLNGTGATASTVSSPRNTSFRSPTTPTFSSAAAASRISSTPSTPTTPRSGKEKENWQVVSSDTRSNPSPIYPRPTNAATTSDLAYTSKVLRNSAFAQASAAYRRSKSDRLMGGAAAYYAEEGKNYDRAYKEFDNLAAEQLVEANSDDYLLDLHGVTVAQGVKIARERTTKWWAESKPDEKGRGIRPLVIVTGVGRHSKNGESRLFPAVKQMLLREGWVHSSGTGKIIVSGRKAGK